MAKRVMEPCDVFLNHRSTDTKRTVTTLLYDHLRRNGFKPFLDEKNMKPGDKLFDKINGAVVECQIGVAVFSPRYCESYFCLHELALLMGCRKKVIPIFCDIKPSQLQVLNHAKWSQDDVRRFKFALEEAKHIVGLTFNSSKGYKYIYNKNNNNNKCYFLMFKLKFSHVYFFLVKCRNLSEMVTNTSDIIIGSMIELQKEKKMKHHLPVPL